MKRTLFFSAFLMAGCMSDPSPDPAVNGGDDSAPAMSCDPSPTRIWKLTPDQYSATVRAMIPSAARAGDPLYASLSYTGRSFTSRADTLEMSPPHVDQLIDSAKQLAELAMKDPSKLQPCLAQGLGDQACVRAFIAGFGERAFRRPLNEEEIGTYLGHFQGAAPLYGGAAALKLCIRAILLSPSFLYRTELGPDDDSPPGAVAMTPWERASALSYLFLDGPPDQELTEAARKGELQTPEQITGQTRRLLSTPEAAAGVFRFFSELFVQRDVPTIRKTRSLFPDFDPLVATDMAEETRRFIEHVIWRDGAKLESLLTANYSFLNKRLADFYGTPGPTGDSFDQVAAPAGQRAGILTQGSLMSALASEMETRPVARGRFIRERLLCQQIPLPPPEISVIPPRLDGVSTWRERLARHTADATCQGCHSLMDPFGLALETYNAIGKYRTVEYGKILDTAGVLRVSGTADRPFGGPMELISLLSSEPRVSACFSRNFYEYASGGNAGLEACQVETLGRRFSETGGDMMDLMVSMTTARGYFLRQRSAKE